MANVAPKRPSAAPLPASHFSGGANITGDLGLAMYLNEMEAFLSTAAMQKSGPIMHRIADTKIRLDKAPGAPFAAMLLNDGSLRTLEAPVDLDIGTPTKSSWLNVYAVPAEDSADMLFVASANEPATGPAGYDEFGFVGPLLIDDKGKIVPFSQRGDGFIFHNRQTPELELKKGRLHLDLSAYIPATASEVTLSCYLGGPATLQALMKLFVYGENESYAYLDLPAGSMAEKETFTIPIVDFERFITYSIESKKYRDTVARIQVKGWTNGYAF